MTSNEICETDAEIAFTIDASNPLLMAWVKGDEMDDLMNSLHEWPKLLSSRLTSQLIHSAVRI